MYVVDNPWVVGMLSPHIYGAALVLAGIGMALIGVYRLVRLLVRFFVSHQDVLPVYDELIALRQLQAIPRPIALYKHTFMFQSPMFVTPTNPEGIVTSESTWVHTEQQKYVAQTPEGVLVDYHFDETEMVSVRYDIKNRDRMYLLIDAFVWRQVARLAGMSALGAMLWLCGSWLCH